MKLIRLAVERPVTTAMVYAALVLVGMISLVLLPRELFPSINYPELLVVTRYGSAAPEEIENIITKLIEEVHENEQRRVKWMYESYFEPETLTLLRHQGVYPYPVPESEG